MKVFLKSDALNIARPSFFWGTTRKIEKDGRRWCWCFNILPFKDWWTWNKYSRSIKKSSTTWGTTKWFEFQRYDLNFFLLIFYFNCLIRIFILIFFILWSVLNWQLFVCSANSAAIGRWNQQTQSSTSLHCRGSKEYEQNTRPSEGIFFFFSWFFLIFNFYFSSLLVLMSC